jgi:hypothetical protein
LNRDNVKVLSAPINNISSDREIPESFYLALNPHNCPKSCYVLFVDIDGDAQEEILYFTSLTNLYAVTVYGVKQDAWVRLGQYNRIFSGSDTNQKIDQL